MRLSQSVVLWQGRVGIQKIVLFGKRPSPYYCKNSSNKQRETTVHHYVKTWRSVNLENLKSFESFKCSRKNLQVLWWNWLSGGPPQERKTRPKKGVTSAAKDTFIRAFEFAAQIDASQSSSNRHISTSTVQRRLCESGLHGWIAAKKTLLKDTNKKNRPGGNLSFGLMSPN